MKVFRGLLEVFTLFLFFLLMAFLLNFIGYRISKIIIAIVLFITGIFLLKNDAFYNKYIKLLFGKENYDKDISHRVEVTCCCSEEIKEKKQHEDGGNFILAGILYSTQLLTTPAGKDVLNIEILHFLGTIIILLLISITCIYLYRKFKNSIQYIFSCLMIISTFIFLFHRLNNFYY